jgi:hypothetical protein
VRAFRGKEATTNVLWRAFFLYVVVEHGVDISRVLSKTDGKTRPSSRQGDNTIIAIFFIGRWKECERPLLWGRRLGFIHIDVGVFDVREPQSFESIRGHGSGFRL